MLYVLVPIYIIVCVFLILVVLLQQGKGADIASAFGASSSQTTFGARGATTLLEKITTWSFVAFSVLAVAISMIQATPKGSVVAKEAKKAAPVAAPAPAAPAPMSPATGIAVPVTPSGATAPATAPSTVPATAAPATEAPAATSAPATK
ncbi:MAG: preprotein translocase subunit SecG [Acidobacteria bacterium]|nr:preprotein translocase subunit SecG [Acidobacteriota bacterium]